MRRFQIGSGHERDISNVNIVERSFEHERQHYSCKGWFPKVASTRSEVKGSTVGLASSGDYYSVSSGWRLLAGDGSRGIDCLSRHGLSQRGPSAGCQSWWPMPVLEPVASPLFHSAGVPLCRNCVRETFSSESLVRGSRLVKASIGADFCDDMHRH